MEGCTILFPVFYLPQGLANPNNSFEKQADENSKINK